MNISLINAVTPHQFSLEFPTSTEVPSALEKLGCCCSLANKNSTQPMSTSQRASCAYCSHGKITETPLLLANFQVEINK